MKIKTLFTGNWLYIRLLSLAVRRTSQSCPWVTQMWNCFTIYRKYSTWMLQNQ